MRWPPTSSSLPLCISPSIHKPMLSGTYSLKPNSKQKCPIRDGPGWCYCWGQIQESTAMEIELFKTLTRRVKLQVYFRAHKQVWASLGFSYCVCIYHITNRGFLLQGPFFFVWRVVPFSLTAWPQVLHWALVPSACKEAPTGVYLRVFRFKHTVRACYTYKFNNCEWTQFRKVVSTSIL